MPFCYDHGWYEDFCRACADADAEQRDPNVPSDLDHLRKMCPRTMAQIEAAVQRFPWNPQAPEGSVTHRLAGQEVISTAILLPLLPKLIGEAYGAHRTPTRQAEGQ